MRRLFLVPAVAALVSCAQPGGDRPEVAGSAVGGDPSAPASPADAPNVRLNGVIAAVRSTRVIVPRLSGPATRLTLTSLIPNGAMVEAGDVVVQFDPLVYLGLARQAAAEFEDLSYQVRQKEAENAASAQQRQSALEEAEAELARALLEVGKAEILSDIDRRQNDLRAERARRHVESLLRSNADHEAADRAALRILELQRDREQRRFERVQANLDRLRVRAPLAGMVAHASRFRSGTMVHPQEGDQLYRNDALLSIFDPSEMLVSAEVGEPDGAFLVPGLEATVYVDAYPDMALRAHFESASPIALSALGSPIKTFSAVFRLDESDPRLMPDLSAAVVLDLPDPGTDSEGAR